MAWDVVSKASGDVLNAADINQLQTNFTALMNQESGAPIPSDFFIGVSSSASTLHVRTSSSGVASPDTSINDVIIEKDSNGGMAILTPDANSSVIIFGSPTDPLGSELSWNHSSSELKLRTASSGGQLIFSTDNATERMRIDSSGNAGFGVSSPIGKFHIKTDSSGVATASTQADDLIIEGLADSGVSILTPDTATSSVIFGSPSNNVGAFIQWVHNGDLLDISTGKSTGEISLSTNTGLERVRIDDSGNIGIGTSIPGSKFDIAQDVGTHLRVGTINNAFGTVDTSVHIRRDNGATSPHCLLFLERENETGWGIGVDSLSSFLIGPNLQTGANSSVFTIESDGDIGIGTNSPSADLEIQRSGDVTFEMENSSSGKRYQLLNSSDDFILQDLSVGNIGFVLESGGNIRLGDSGTKISTGGEAAPDVDDGGLCLNHGDNDGFVLTLKNSDVAHGMTDFVETDTYAALSKSSPASGGLEIEAFTEIHRAIRLSAYATTEDTTDTSASDSACDIVCSLKSGTGDTNMGTTANMFTIQNNGTTRFLLKGNGDIFAANTTITALDDHNDIDLARNLQLSLGGESYKHKVNKKDFKKLVELKAISEDGEFQILQGCTAVTLGAISQLFNALKGVAFNLGISEEELIKMARTY